MGWKKTVIERRSPPLMSLEDLLGPMELNHPRRWGSESCHREWYADETAAAGSVEKND